MTQTFEERDEQDCGCVQIVERDVSGKVVKQDLNHCIAHSLEWAGKFLCHAGRRLIEETKKPAAPTVAIYRNESGKRLWVENPYPHPVPHVEGEVLLHDHKGYRVVKADRVGEMLVFVVQECDPADATVVRDAVVDHLKKHGFEEPTNEAGD